MTPQSESLIQCGDRGAGGAACRRARAVLCRLKGEEGVNLLEYGFIAILSMLLILGVTDFGRMLYTYHYLSNTARDAARWASVNGSICKSADNSCNGTNLMNNGPASAADVATYVTKIAPAGINSASPPLTTTATWPVQANGPQTCTVTSAGALNCTAVCTTTNNAPGCTVEVQVSYKFTFLFPLIRNSQLTLTSKSMEVISH